MLRREHHVETLCTCELVARNTRPLQGVYMYMFPLQCDRPPRVGLTSIHWH